MKNIWSIISGVAAVIAVSLTLFIFFHSELVNRKSLEITLISQTSLVNEELGSNKAKLEVRYDGKSIRNYTLLQFRIENTGRQTIRKEDFYTPLTIDISGAEAIISWEKVSSDPNNIDIVITPTNLSVVLENTLLNPTDWYIVEIGVIPSTKAVPIVRKVFARISGIKEVEYNSGVKPTSQNRSKIFISVFTIAFSVLGSIFAFYLALYKKRMNRIRREMEAYRCGMEESMREREKSRHERETAFLNELQRIRDKGTHPSQK
jgi:hypothetical protein